MRHTILRSLCLIFMAGFLFCSQALRAQDDALRAVSTKVVDALQQLPAPTPSVYDQVMQDLFSTAGEGVDLLAQMLNQNTAAKPRVVYALGGLAAYVSGKPRAQRSPFIEAYTRALTQVTQDGDKVFLQQQITLMGGPLAHDFQAVADIPVYAPQMSPKAVLTALKSPDRATRVSALQAAQGFDEPKFYAKAIKQMAKADAETKADVIAFLGQEKDPANLEAIVPYLGNTDFALVQAAALACVQIGGPQAVEALARMLVSPYSKITHLATQSLNACAGDVATEAMKHYDRTSANGKMAILRLIAHRRALAHRETVFSLLKAESPEVVRTAYNCLKDVVLPQDRNRLAALLEAAPQEFRPACTEALWAAVAELPAPQPFDSLLALAQASAKPFLYGSLLARTEDARALPLLQEAYAQAPEGEVKTATFEALAACKGLPAAQALYDICVGAPSSDLFHRAFDLMIDRIRTAGAPATQSLPLLRKAMDLARTAEQKQKVLRQVAQTPDYAGVLFLGKYLDDPQCQHEAAKGLYALGLQPRFRSPQVEELLRRTAPLLQGPDSIYEVAAIEEYLSKKPVTESSQLSPEEKAEGFVHLFDGSNLDQWEGNKVDYTVTEGCIYVSPVPRSKGDSTTKNLYTRREYADFVYRFAFRLTPGANNGVGIRTPMEGDAAYVGMEIQILDHYDAIYQPNLRDYQYHGSVYGIIPAQYRDALRPVGEWNEEEIYAKGDYIRVTVNGRVVTEGNLREAVAQGTYDKREHPGILNPKGYIGFLGHGSELWIRNVRIKEL